MQTLPVFGQISEAIDQGIDLSGDTISGVIGDNVPIENAGQLTKDGFNILKSIYHVMRSVHHFVVQLMTTIVSEGQSPEEAARLAETIGFGSIVVVIFLGLRLLRGIWRHLILASIIIFLVIIAASFIDNKLSLPF